GSEAPSRHLPRPCPDPLRGVRRGPCSEERTASPDRLPLALSPSSEDGPRPLRTPRRSPRGARLRPDRATRRRGRRTPSRASRSARRGSSARPAARPPPARPAGADAAGGSRGSRQDGKASTPRSENKNDVTAQYDAVTKG